MYYLQINTSGMLMLQKKFLHVFIKSTQNKNLLSVDKEEVLRMVQHAFPYANSLKYVLAGNEKTTYSAIYEVSAGIHFGNNQPSVHKITYRTENKPTSLEEQTKSLLLTKQKNCDLSVEYTDIRTSTKVMSMLDVLIGVNKSTKGNLMFIPPNSIGNINNHYKYLLSTLEYFCAFGKNRTNNEQEILISHITKIKSIWASNKTPAAKIIDIQEIVIQSLTICRKSNPNYNPHMIAFIPTQPSQQISELSEKIAYDISKIGGLTANTPDKVVVELFETILPMYLKNKKPNLQFMQPEDRKLCLSFIEQYAPTLLKIFTEQ